MIEKDQLILTIKQQLPGWQFSARPAGQSVWINVNNGAQYFELQVTPDEGVGLSLSEGSDGVDFSGHEEVFTTLDEAISYLTKFN